MSNVMQFLEALGSNPALNRLPAADYEAMVASLEADEAQRDALLGADPATLNGLLGGRVQPMMMSQWAPGQQPFKEDEEREGDEPSDEPTPDAEPLQ